MGNIVSIFTGVFSTPTDYSQMLQKLASFAFWEIYIITFVLRSVPDVDCAFRSLEAFISLTQLAQTFPAIAKINVAGFAIALIAATLSHIFHFHDRLSDLLKIRELFDCKHIAFPLAKLVNASPNKSQRERFRAQGHTQMRVIFYQYASSKAENPVVDKHDIQHALSNWTWFWIFEEGAAYLAAAAIIASFTGAFRMSAYFYLVSIALIFLGIAQYRRMPGYARAEIEQIARNPTAASEVRQAFDAL